MAGTRLVRSGWLVVLGVALGAGAGLLLGWAVNAALVPVLDRYPGSWAELSGPLWNLVPLLTIAGGVAGGLLARGTYRG